MNFYYFFCQNMRENIKIQYTVHEVAMYYQNAYISNEQQKEDTTSAELLTKYQKLYNFNMHIQTLNNYLFNIQKYASVKHQHD